MEEGTDPATENDWSLLPFMALADGAHSYVDFFMVVETVVHIRIPENHLKIWVYSILTC